VGSDYDLLNLGFNMSSPGLMRDLRNINFIREGQGRNELLDMTIEDNYFDDNNDLEDYVNDIENMKSFTTYINTAITELPIYFENQPIVPTGGRDYLTEP
jgi:hypothetical protein